MGYPPPIEPPQPTSALEPGLAIRHLLDIRRLVVGILLLVGSIFIAVSASTPLWSLTQSEFSGAIDYVPGSSYQMGAGVGLLVGAYGAPSTGQITWLYEGILVGMVVALILCFVAGLVATLAAVGVFRSLKGQRFLSLCLVLAIAALAVPVVLTPIVQPMLQNCNGMNGPSTPCTSFWGSARFSSPLQETATWSAGIGWYLAAVSAALSLGSLVALRRFERNSQNL